MAEYRIGSEWRRWDLHVHTPNSIVQNYGGNTPQVWDRFVTALAALPEDITALAVTDYLFCDGYEQLLARRNEFPNVKLLIPNIEFRLNTFAGTTNNNKRHNFHVLFDPDLAVQVIREQLLNCLATGYRISDNSVWHQTPTPTSLTELGRQMKAAAPADNTIQSKTDLQVGFDNITYRREDIDKLLGKSPFKGRFVTAIGYSEWNSARWDQSAAEKRDLINRSDFALTSLDDPAAILENRADLATNKLNELVLHSSDAHDFDRLGKTQLWIKADPTFAGLKQVLNEPKARVFVGATPPNFKPDHKVISKINVSTSAGWFANDFSLELNRDLVTIIGGRGSGKSALAEAIAFGAGKRDESDDAFFTKAAKHRSSINGTTVRLDWADGTATEFTVGSPVTDKELVRYLPQGAVEELCSPDNSEVLQRQIENVIFQALDQTQRLGASDFGELKKRILAEFNHEKEQVVRKIRLSNKRVTTLIQAIHSRPQKEKQLAEQRAELERLNSTLPELPEEDKRGQDELASLTELRRTFEARIVEFTTRLGRLTEAENLVKVFHTRIAEYAADLAPILAELGIADRIPFEVTTDVEGTQAIFDATRRELQTSLNTLRNGTRLDVSTLLGLPQTDLPLDNLTAINAAIQEKQKATRAFETTKLKYQQQKTAAVAVEERIKALTAEIAKIDADSVPERDRLETDRLITYASYFDLLRREKDKIEQLYLPLQESLTGGSDTDRKLVFAARVQYRLDGHCKAGLDIIDRSRRGPFRELSALKVALSRLWDQVAREDFSTESLKREISSLLENFQMFEGSQIEIEHQLRENSTREDFYNWLFDPSNFEIASSLTFDGADLYVLSPGQKGIILLMLYLQIDKTDNRPLIIDQPEENLDNLSVYTDLIEYFRDRKQCRQIVMVTHNPNLVVNTDAEQVIVANYDGHRTPRLNYSSGSLEDQAKHIPNVPVEDLEDGIIEQVCNILEGGEPAFDRRKRKYGLSRKSAM